MDYRPSKRSIWGLNLVQMETHSKCHNEGRETIYMRKLLVVLLLVLFLSACKTDNIDLGEKYQAVWDEIVNQEYTADNGWAGEGIYFYEKDSQLYCDYLLYGSGVRVMGLIPMDVSFDEEANIVLTMPYSLSIHDFDNESTEMVEVTLEYVDGTFIWEDLVFEDIDLNFHPNLFEE